MVLCSSEKQGSDKIMVKSPAPVFYYSGHGHSNLDVDPSLAGTLISVTPALSPERLSSWKENPSTIKALIIAGCSVCSIHKIKHLKDHKNAFDGKNRDGVGMRWSELLTSKGGRVENVCGYWASAPRDEPIGNKIAENMGKKIAENINSNHAENWVKIHFDLFHHPILPDTEVAVASMTDNTFYYI
jgi:hypothetical protein